MAAALQSATLVLITSSPQQRLRDRAKSSARARAGCDVQVEAFELLERQLAGQRPSRMRSAWRAAMTAKIDVVEAKASSAFAGTLRAAPTASGRRGLRRTRRWRRADGISGSGGSWIDCVFALRIAAKAASKSALDRTSTTCICIPKACA
ncbi:MAG: hypothetical protein U5J78_03430 [Parasphingorhabdus sp.]|nr:hypothetical protein [Parasphingorhabdus sp.]